MRRFGGGNRTERKQTIIEKISKFFEKYFGIFNTNDEESKFEYDITDEEDNNYFDLVAEEKEEYK